MSENIPVEINLHQQSSYLTLKYSDKAFDLTAEYLRVYSPSAEVMGHRPGQEKLQIGKENVSIQNIVPVGNYAIGIFFENQCIGWGYYQNNITIIPTIGDDGQNPQFPVNEDLVSFYIYDDSEDLILSLQSLEDIPLWYVDTWQNISNLYGCQYNLPIHSDGSCPENCNLDPNLDQNIDILDIMYLIDIILYCNDCEISCGDINNDNQLDLQDIIIILEIVLTD